MRVGLKLLKNPCSVGNTSIGFLMIMSWGSAEGGDGIGVPSPAVINLACQLVCSLCKISVP